MDNNTLTRLCREAMDIVKLTEIISSSAFPVAYGRVLDELIRQEKAREELAVTEGAEQLQPIKIRMVFGKDKSDIERNARNIADMPGGEVGFDSPVTESSIVRGKCYADVTVTPASGDRFTEEELKKAARELTGGFALRGISPDKFMERIAAQVRKNRAYAAGHGQ